MDHEVAAMTAEEYEKYFDLTSAIAHATSSIFYIVRLAFVSGMFDTDQKQMNDESRSGSPKFDCNALRRTRSAKVQHGQLSAPKTAVVGLDSTRPKRQFVGRYDHRPGRSPVSLLSFLKAENSKLRKDIVELSLDVIALRRLLVKDRLTSNIFGDATKLTR